MALCLNYMSNHQVTLPPPPPTQSTFPRARALPLSLSLSLSTSHYQTCILNVIYFLNEVLKHQLLTKTIISLNMTYSSGSLNVSEQHLSYIVIMSL